MASFKEHFLERLLHEHATSVRVLKAFPANKLDFKPHERSMAARDLMWLFVSEQMMSMKALTEGFDWSKPPEPMPKAPETMDEILATFEKGYEQLVATIGGMDDQALQETIQFYVAPKTLGDVPKMEFLWIMLLDQIHHRGQLSVYLRLAGGKVPSIYGPSADEPWF